MKQKRPLRRLMPALRWVALVLALGAEADSAAGAVADSVAEEMTACRVKEAKSVDLRPEFERWNLPRWQQGERPT